MVLMTETFSFTLKYEKYGISFSKRKMIWPIVNACVYLYIQIQCMHNSPFLKTFRFYVILFLIQIQTFSPHAQITELHK